MTQFVVVTQLPGMESVAGTDVYGPFETAQEARKLMKFFREQGEQAHVKPLQYDPRREE